MLSNLENNRISASLTAQDVSDVKAAIATIESKLPFLLGLNAEEKQRLPKISRSNKFFVDDTIKVARENQSLLPQYFNLPEFEKDYQLFKKLSDISLSLSQLAEKVSDTKTLAGSESYVAALSVYKMVQYASQAGIPGTDSLYELLKARFEGQGTANNTEPSKEEQDNLPPTEE